MSRTRAAEKQSMARFRVPAGAPTPHNCFKHFCQTAQLSLAGCRSRLLRGQSDVSHAESDAEDAAGEPNHCSGILMQPLWGPREHPEPDTHRAVGNRAPASPAPTSHWQPTAAGAAVPGTPESENSQVHHKPGCEAAWRSPWHAPRGVSGRLILIITVLSLPGPVQAQASPDMKRARVSPHAGLCWGGCAQPAEKTYTLTARLSSTLRLFPSCPQSK